MADRNRMRNAGFSESRIKCFDLSGKRGSECPADVCPVKTKADGA